MKMRSAKLLIDISAFACAMVFATASFAIPIVNSSFEILGGPLSGTCGTGCSYTLGSPIPGWTIGGAVGQFQPGVPEGNFAYFDTLPDGPTVAYSNDGSISQTVGSTVELGVTYKLLVDQGLRKDIGDPGTVALVIGNNAILASGTPPAPGGWQTFTAIYTGLADDVGKSITIRLTSPGVQGDWDNVRLDATTAVPEPETISLIGLALVGMTVVARRRHVTGAATRS